MKPRRNEEARAHIGPSSHTKKNNNNKKQQHRGTHNYTFTETKKLKDTEKWLPPQPMMIIMAAAAAEFYTFRDTEVLF
jgi:hypothetical protein